MNLLYYGDNLDVMRRHIKDETVDLVYLDPPFNSNTNYNVLFAEKDGSKAASQIQAFSDTWTWNQESESTYAEIVMAGGKVSDCLQAFRTFLGECDMLAYLVMMAPRLVELRRVMKSTASIYLHCDPTASHYLKMLMDAVFGPANFRNEIIWKRTTSKSLMTRRLPSNHDVILSYQASPAACWNADAMFSEYDLDNLDEKTTSKYSHKDKDGRLYRLDNLCNPNRDRPNLTYEFLGITKVWRWTKERMQKAYEDGFVIQPSPGAVPCFKRYIDEQKGKPLDDVWTDIPPLNSQAAERLGYPTQKPVALLERIIRASCPEGGVVLDPFCGCGTTIAAAQALDRPWIGIDITHLAITLIKQRMKDSFGVEQSVRATSSGKGETAKIAETATEYGNVTKRSFHVLGEPTSEPDAAALAASDPYQFQWWALGLVGARPVEQKKGADKGIDGRIIFQGDKKGTFESVILSVKAGKTGSAHIRDLKGVLDREKAAIGILISMEHPTKPMLTEAVTAGFYESATWGQKYPKMQLLTISELLAGKKVEMPPIKQVSVTFKTAPKETKKKSEQHELDV
ncbi:MAG: DNA methyltransferase [Syntrophus sp. (in: bacteria)]